MRLSQYVAKRNGVPFGSNRSLPNMLYRSLGAGSFARFWQYWNPIWGYYLGKHVFKPLRQYVPASLAVLLTFGVSGLVHDGVIMAVRQELALIFTPWFLLMALWLLISEAIGLRYDGLPWITRVAINILIIGVFFAMAWVMQV